MLEALSQLKLIDELQLHQQILHINSQLIAINYHHNLLMKKSFQAIKINIIYQEQLNIKKQYFSQWKIQVKMSKIQKNIVMNRLFKGFASIKKIKQNAFLENIRKQEADNHYESKLKQKAFRQWKLDIQFDKKIHKCQNFIKKCRLSQFLAILQDKKNSKFTRQISTNIYENNLMKRFFQQWVLASKISSLLKKRKLISFPQIIQRIKSFNQSQKIKCQNHYIRYLYNNSFQLLKINWKTNKARKYFESKLKIKYFKKWEKQIGFLFYQKEEELKNQEILQQHLLRKNRVKLYYYFSKWHKKVEDKKSDKYKNMIARQYGLVKEKQSLLKKYFEAWASLKNHNIAENFRKIKLKTKVWQGLKLFVFQSVQKWQKLYQFVQKRQKAKYFMAIISFNQKQNFKVSQHLKKKAFNNFGKAIVKQYICMNKKADIYRKKSLMYKTLYGLKIQADLKNKQKRSIIYIHCNMSLKRWHRRYKIRKFVEQRNYLTLGKVFLQLKLNKMNKQWSESQKHYKSQQQIELSLQKITMQSPSKLFSLQYSLSNYNSNNVFQI